MIWIGIAVGCGLLYWLSGFFGTSLLQNGKPLGHDLNSLMAAIYFSFVTATSVGYGDVLPAGPIRVLAVAEGAMGLLMFGAIIAKFVSRRQDEIVREIHEITFEERLDRVQMNLHLILSELQSIAGQCSDPKATATPELAARIESSCLVFAAELRAIHSLLYRPNRVPGEVVLGAILASLSSGFQALNNMVECLPRDYQRSQVLDRALHRVAELADEICAECVPQRYTPALGVWMDRVQAQGRRLAQTVSV